MKEIRNLVQHIAPTLASALGGPFSGVATKFITDKMVEENESDVRSPEEIIKELLTDSENLRKIKELDQSFDKKMRELDVDVFELETDYNKDGQGQARIYNKPQIIISILFLIAYFLMLTAIFSVEASDTINMKQGENSLMGELQILFGVLTAGVGQILSFWFGGALGKKESISE